MVAILALDTSTSACSVALNIDGVVLEDFRMAPRQHNDLILPMVEQILQQAGVAIQDLDAIAFGRGPGSFTGLRISAGIVQGLAYGADLPVIPISTLAAQALEGFQKTGLHHWLSALDARMGEIYVAGYFVDKVTGGDKTTERYSVKTLLDERVIQPERLEALSLPYQGVGSGWRYDEILTGLLPAQPEQVLVEVAPRAACIAQLAIVAFEKGETVSAYDAIPIYLRDEITWEKQAPRIGKR
ncbi:tRNA threonylcarbamoyladenosine biosynthesis protein TsaB [Marinomonas spartinae]|uniref:tRNA threonylcarbamoyladenosine biosynthesis protein TsaB n=1 Tax=Marinomonas spartinae TaxID=1792290 RepID=A0A1A8TAN7_9GAMM|nr:tRNA (adenosine(37)-N6)-threonylcarbamoyltransferase complex dimerization subunit type 1 TsaB [Marinomonas spartinae]SBS27788.1 tRNA threonylcarbamoyladenosine biosynthesis protein TsaB [Marinomonas spartinae]SBS28588.1 tRNA threonylcarbamoyladenosine biosynthesis protein TsaB [Marinomonas spartinae]